MATPASKKGTPFYRVGAEEARRITGAFIQIVSLQTGNEYAGTAQNARLPDQQPAPPSSSSRWSLGMHTAGSRVPKRLTFASNEAQSSPSTLCTVLVWL